MVIRKNGFPAADDINSFGADFRKERAQEADPSYQHKQDVADRFANNRCGAQPPIAAGACDMPAVLLILDDKTNQRWANEPISKQPKVLAASKSLTYPRKSEVAVG